MNNDEEKEQHEKAKNMNEKKKKETASMEKGVRECRAWQLSLLPLLWGWGSCL
jgi:hypothetical protein